MNRVHIHTYIRHVVEQSFTIAQGTLPLKGTIKAPGTKVFVNTVNGRS